MTPHLRGHVRAYVDRTLPESLLRLFDQHLVACEVCRAAAEQERRIVLALQADTGVPQSLHSMLLGLATTEPQVPAVPAAPARVRVNLPASPFRDPQPAPRHPALRHPVPTVAPNAPALHRSPVRAAVFASLAATASVAAAWGLSVVPLQAGSRAPVPSARVPVEATRLTPAPLSQVVPVRTVVSSPVGVRDLRLAPTDQSGAQVSAPASIWAVTRALGLPDLVGSVRVGVVGSTQSGP
ncbi:hypothetical protein [Intrasporangium sp.]|uniref:hypothetical protein n=1 Tax=Intrasporangium sp. TaxID=1925024 RepID=UPI003221B669